MRRAVTLLAVAAWLGVHALLWTLLPPVPRFVVPDMPIHTRPVFTADGRRLIIKAADRIQTWDVSSGQRLRAVPCPSGVLDTILPSPDGRWLLVYDAPRQESLLIDSASGRQTARTPIENLDNDLFRRCCCFSPDGRVAALVIARLKDPEFSVRLWDVEAASERAILRDSLYPMQFSPDGRTLVAESYAFDPHHLRLWDVTTGQIRGTLPGFEPAEPYSRLAFSPDGRRLLGTGLDRNGGWSIVVWDVTARQVRAEHADIPVAAWAADGVLVVLSMNPKWSMHIEVHDPDTGARESGPEFSAVRDAVAFPTGLPHPAALSDDGRFLLTRFSHPAPAWVRWLVERLPAARRVLSDKNRSAVQVWESQTGRRAISLWRETESALLAPDGRLLVTVEPDRALRVWDVPPRTPGGIVLGLMIVEVSLAIAWTWLQRRLFRTGRKCCKSQLNSELH